MIRLQNFWLSQVKTSARRMLKGVEKDNPVSTQRFKIVLLMSRRLISMCLLGYGTSKIQWLEHLWNHEKMFETGVVRANEC